MEFIGIGPTVEVGVVGPSFQTMASMAPGRTGWSAMTCIACVGLGVRWSYRYIEVSMTRG